MVVGLSSGWDTVRTETDGVCGGNNENSLGCHMWLTYRQL